MRGASFAIVLLVSLAIPPARAARLPNGPYEIFHVHSDGAGNAPAEIVGWYLPASEKARGTLFICHGYDGSKNRMARWDWARDECGWNVVLFDFREHGESTHTGGLTTLGYNEKFDLRAVIDYAEKRGAEKPYAAYGRSMGAATALIEAADDRRISAVCAMSPFRTGWSGAKQMLANRYGTGWLPTLLLHGEYKRELLSVDVAQAVSQRDDLRLWMMSGQLDCFPESDQRAILAACRSPDTMKRYFLIPGLDHYDTWRWEGSDSVPGYDNFLRAFLRASERPTLLARPGRRWAAVALLAVAAGSVAFYWHSKTARTASR